MPALVPHKPLVWLPACHRHLDLSDPGGYTVLADRYAAAVCELGMQPVLFPMAGANDVKDLLPLVDGVLLTGSPSNVEASHFGAQALDTDLLDPRRDALTMALVRTAIAEATPLFGVCRGLQEINVALGGSLYQRVHDEQGFLDHREPGSSRTGGAVRRAARGAAGAGQRVRAVGAAARARWSIRCTGRASKSWARDWWPRPMRPTGWWKACA